MKNGSIEKVPAVTILEDDLRDLQMRYVIKSSSLSREMETSSMVEPAAKRKK